MSRAVFTNARYVFAFGGDHAIGTFFSIEDLERPKDEEPLEEEDPSIDVDSLFGVRVKRLGILMRNTQLSAAMDSLRKGWEACKTSGILHPNMAEEDIIDIGKALGFTSPVLEKEVYELWG